MTVTICGWCPDAREETARLVAQGHKVSHGCCSRCATQLLASLDAGDNAKSKETKR